MLRIVLFQPEIPPNTGNIIRLSANIGAELHLIKPLGFELDERRLRRAGLDYHEFAHIQVHDDLNACWHQLQPTRYLVCTTKAEQRHTDIQYRNDEVLLFGCETRGLPPDILAATPKQHQLRIPMQAHSRSLNLSNAVAVIAYEAWRQHDFNGQR